MIRDEQTRLTDTRGVHKIPFLSRNTDQCLDLDATMLTTVLRNGPMDEHWRRDWRPVLCPRLDNQSPEYRAWQLTYVGDLPCLRL